MTREEIENRIMICELRANEYREVGNTKTASRYDNEKHKWEKLLSDLDLLNERNTKELLEYKRGYFDLQEQNQKYKEVINKIKEWEQNHTILVYTKNAPRKLVGTHELLHILYDKKVE